MRLETIIARLEDLDEALADCFPANSMYPDPEILLARGDVQDALSHLQDLVERLDLVRVGR